MYAKRLSGLLLLTATAALLSGCQGENDNTAEHCQGTHDGPDAAWQADIDCAAYLIDRHHPAPYSKVSKQQFDDAVHALKEAVPALSTTEVIAELMALTATIDDIHTTVTAPSRLLPRAPVTFGYFDDGVYVTRIPEADADKAGARVIGINGLAVEDAFAALAPLSPDETDGMRDHESAVLLSYPGLLWARDIAAEPQRSLVSLESFDEPLAIDVDATYTGTVPAPDPESSDLPVSFLDRERNYWTTLVPEMRLVYIQYNLCFEDAEYALDAFVEDVAGLLDRPDADRVLIDLRANPGGYASLIAPLHDVLEEQAGGKPVYVAIGPRTFSAAIQNAVELRDALDAVLLGNETIERVNHTGDVNHFVLPNSGLSLRVGSTQLEVDPGNDGALVPDVVLPRRGSDYVNGIDPVLDWLAGN